jgi:hypothetical protein
VSGRFALLVVALVGPVAASTPVVAATDGYHLSRSTVYVENRAPAEWRTDSAVRSWDASSAVSVRYGSCRSEYPCIKVRVYRDASERRFGYLTQNYRSKSKTLTSGTAWLNDGRADYRGLTSSQRRKVVCHELGHALGLEHQDGRSCMNIYGWTNVPNAEDYRDLHRLY